MSDLFFVYIILLFFINELILRNNFFFDRIEFSKHKSFVNSKKTPTAGGVLLLSFILIFFKNFSVLSFFLFILDFFSRL